MNRSVAIAFFILFSLQAFSQYSLRVGYNFNNYDKWDQISEDYIPNHMEAGVSYWFRLKNYRLEFLPELIVGFAPSSSYTFKAVDYADKFQYGEFRFNTHFYLFDLKEDCDCPTFSKQSPSLLKGLYVFIAPGVRYSQRKVNLSDASTPPGFSFDNDQVLMTLGAGLGFDIGLNDFVTLSPSAGVILSLNDEVNNAVTNNLEIEKDSWNSILFSLRMMMRFDYLSTPKWRR